jgi:hypothetical protein
MDVPGHDIGGGSGFRGWSARQAARDLRGRDAFGLALSEMARLTLARKIAAITPKIWKNGEPFEAEHLKVPLAGAKARTEPRHRTCTRNPISAPAPSPAAAEGLDVRKTTPLNKQEECFFF